jgi:hypothetical protein
MTVEERDLTTRRLGDISDVDKVFQEVCSDLLRAADWYMDKKKVKRRWSRFLRLMSICFAVAGGLVPFLHSLFEIRLELGYVLLAVAGGLQFLDRAFGYSFGWARQLKAALALESCLREFELTYAEEVALGRSDEQKWLTLRQFSQRGWDIISLETAEWVEGHTRFTSELPGSAVQSPKLKNLESTLGTERARTMTS